LRWHLVLLLVGALLPVVLFAAAVVLRLSGEERAAVQRRLLVSARTMAADVDRELSITTRTLEALAESDRLDPFDGGDLASFHEEARRVQRTQPSWRTVLLLSPQSRVLLSTSLPWGAPLPPVSEPASLERTLRTGRPQVGDLARGSGGRWVFPVRAPVVRQGKVRYVLTAAIAPEGLADLVRPQSLQQEEWTRTVVDGTGRVVARTRQPERFVGQKGSSEFLRRMRAAREGVYRSTTLDGVEVYSAVSRAPFSGWTAIVTVPVEVIEDPVRRSLLAVAGLGLALLVLSGTGALVLARRMSRGIESAAAAADALAHGEPPRVAGSGVAEVARLAEALSRSADLLRDRECERDEHLARAEAARAEAEAANRTKDEFLAMLGHELRNPLSPIVTAVALLKMRGLEQAREIGIIERQVQHLTRLVDDLLDTSRITRGKIELHKEPVELATVVAKAVEMSSPLFAERGHHLTVDVPPAGLELHGDPVRLQQVLANLLTNAARYTPRGGQIRVEARREEGEARLAVTDDGQGLSDDLLPRVFDLFVQGPRTLDRREGGLGIGLTLVKSLVQLHGGQVEARSDGPGKGSTFLVRLPLLATPQTTAAPLAAGS
jgi:signal transduction histidine kinase